MLILDYAVPRLGVANIKYRFVNCPGSGGGWFIAGEVPVPFCLGCTMEHLTEHLKALFAELGQKCTRNKNPLDVLNPEFQDQHGKPIPPRAVLNARVYNLVALVTYNQSPH
jgi:hypothetical protein